MNGTTTLSDAARSLRETRAGLLCRPDLAGADLRGALADAYDAWLRELTPLPAGVALVAVGGLGRREPAPYSDVDLVLLHDGPVAGLGALADSIWYPIWDAGVALDHAVRTPAEALTVARNDLRALLGLLDIRHVSGEADLTARVRTAVLEMWRSTARKRVAELGELARERWAIAGDAAFLLEPNVKESRGGLRDAQALRALAAAQLVDVPVWVREAYPVLLDVRGELHRSAGRADDVLHQQDQDDVAARLGFADRPSGAATQEGRDQLLRRVNEAARAVASGLDMAERRTRNGAQANQRRWPFTVRPVPTRVGIAKDVVAQNGEVVLARDADPRADPALVLRVARAAAERDLPLAPFALERLAAESAPMPTPWPAAARADLLAVLGSGRPAIAVLEALDHAGLLVRLIPEWDAVRCRAQHNPVHRYTVDRHLLETAAYVAEDDGGAERRDLLLIGALLHDIGKGVPGADHSVAGASLAANIARRLGFAEDDVAVIVALVRHHLLLPNTATRRDLDDPMTVGIVRDSINGSAELLDLLHVLTVADAAATGPAAWSEWKAGLVADLVGRTRAATEGKHAPTGRPLDAQRRALAERGELAVVFDGEEGDSVVVAAPDTGGTLYRMVGVLALHALDIREASISTHRGMAVNRFVVSPRFGRMPDAALVRSDLLRATRGELALTERLADKERSYAPAGSGAAQRRIPTVRWFDDSADATVVEFRGADEIGLLCRITAALERAGLDVRAARISSVAGVALGAFYVTGPDGRPIAAADRPRLESLLRAAW